MKRNKILNITTRKDHSHNNSNIRSVIAHGQHKKKMWTEDNDKEENFTLTIREKMRPKTHQRFI